jgi:hypothetical protein
MMSASWLVVATVTAALAGSPAARAPRQDPPNAQQDPIAVLKKDQAAREAKLALLRSKAYQRASDDSRVYSNQELRDIEMQYQATRLAGLLTARDAGPRLQELVEKYPRSNRAGCAVLELARLASGNERERYLKLAIADHDDAWFEDGAQVGPLARALLAMYYAELDRFDDAERLATEIVTHYPGSIDSGGGSLDDVLPALKLLRPPK